MYDEKMIEDSLAFAEEIRARLEGKNIGDNSEKQEKASVSVSSRQPISGKMHGQTEEPYNRLKPAQTGQGQSQSRPVQKKAATQNRQAAPSLGQPVAKAVSRSQADQASAQPGQMQPGMVQSGRSVSPVKPPATNIVNQPQSDRTSTQPGQMQPGTVQSGRSVSPVKQAVTNTVSRSQAGQASAQLGQMQPGMTQSRQAVSSVKPSATDTASRSQAGQVSAQPRQMQPGTTQSRQVVSSVEPPATNTVSRSQADQASAQPRQMQPGTVQRGQSVSPVKQAVTNTVDQPDRSVQQSAAGMTQQGVAAVQQPVFQTAQTQQDQKVSITELPEGQINRQSMPESLHYEQKNESETGKVPAVPKAEQPKKEHLISVSTSTTRPVHPKSSALDTISKETRSMDEEEEQDHTVEITIKFDIAGIKKKLAGIKKKLAPEERTLEEVNAAMEENRQLKAEKQQASNESVAEKGEEFAHKAAIAAKGAGRKISGILKKKSESAVTLEDGMAVDGEVVQLEGEAVEEGGLAQKIQDIKEIIPGKADKASKLVTNIIIIAFCIGIAYFLASFVTSYVAHQTTVEGESMEPTLTDGDSVIIERLSYYFKDPKRYDVVVFPVHYDSTSSEETYYIKRVIGLPGETVQIIDGSVYINNEKLSDDKYASAEIQEAGIAEKPLVLGPKQYFVMGDNRNMSTDSRNSYVGLVNKNDIIGEAWLCTWPLNHFGTLK
ncbi:MAG: signal peptidase I [Lachnospiraceae bacterium]|nr:signal peptidase I [Lachnospiraceae bacterium]